ncbi:hypothetical protein JCM6882_008753 [Rhodosporidiobolus microsporus]
MRFSLSAALVALVATSASAAHDGSLRARGHVSTCAPATSDYLWNVLANKVHNIAFASHNKQITKVDTKFESERSNETKLMWNVAKLDNGNYQIQTGDGTTCLRARGEGINIAAYTCDDAAAEYKITCQTCGTSSCGDPFSSGCTIQSTDVKGQCITRLDGKLVSSACKGNKAQLWDFELA